MTFIGESHMRRILTITLMFLVALANVRFVPAQFSGLQPVSATHVANAPGGPAAGVTHEQRPLPLTNQDMQGTRGAGFWSSLGDFLERAGEALLEGLAIGLILGLGVCETNPQFCGM
jgi:hypothetical protein